MYNFEREIADTTILHEGFNLSQLWALREELNLIIQDLEELKELAISIRDKKELRETEEKLFFLNRNVNLVEETMMDKENEIFEFLICNEFCLN